LPLCRFCEKPLKIGFKKALSILSITDKSKVLVIGDQVMTDVLGSKRMGLKVHLVDAIKRNNEKWFTRLNRRFENRMLNQIKKKNGEAYTRLNLKEKR
jgi:predicted HAD superfamily phosphohydrolase YqeG